MYSMALYPRFFKWNILSLSGPKALLFLQLLIALLTRSVVNVCGISKDFLFVSLVTNRVSLEEVCLPSFDVFRLVITSNISAGTGSSWCLCRPVGMWCDAALSKTVRLISLAVCWKGTLAQHGIHFLSVSVPVRLLQVDVDPGWRSSSSVI